MTGLDLDGSDLCPANFPLPNLGAKLRALNMDLYDGKGFSVVRGINPKMYDVVDLTLTYLGVQSRYLDENGRNSEMPCSRCFERKVVCSMIIGRSSSCLECVKAKKSCDSPSVASSRSCCSLPW